VYKRQLLSGDHKKIEEFRRRAALEKTLKNRPDLLQK
jgi:tRNA (guanine37-N1)-methyltransferase